MYGKICRITSHLSVSVCVHEIMRANVFHFLLYVCLISFTLSQHRAVGLLLLFFFFLYIFAQSNSNEKKKNEFLAAFFFFFNLPIYRQVGRMCAAYSSCKLPDLFHGSAQLENVCPSRQKGEEKRNNLIRVSCLLFLLFFQKNRGRCRWWNIFS